MKQNNSSSPDSVRPVATTGQGFMDYNQMIKWHKTHKGKAQYMGFSTLSQNERRRTPWLGGVWFEIGKEKERAEFIRKWEAETEKMLKENPNLKII